MEAQTKKIKVMFNKELENIKNNQTESNNIITEMKITLEGISSTINEAEEWISELEDRVVENTAIEQNKKKEWKEIKTVWDHWDNVKHTNICIIGVLEGEGRENGPEKPFEEIIAENFPDMRKETVTQVQEAQRVPYRINPRRNMLRHIVIKLTKLKDKVKILKVTRGK